MSIDCVNILYSFWSSVDIFIELFSPQRPIFMNKNETMSQSWTRYEDFRSITVYFVTVKKSPVISAQMEKPGGMTKCFLSSVGIILI